VHGRVDKNSGEISKPVGRDPVRRTRMKAGGIAARQALTHYRVLRRFPHFTLLDVQPATGRTHQIRVHLASIGHPVVGDLTYGAPSKLGFKGREVATLSRTFLHAAKLAFAHPITGDPVRFEAPLPDELAEFVRQVESLDALQGNSRI
jgi:23S rRNA pseudouridine1911/1915/1917 synthase